MLQAVKQNGGALAYADPALQEDRGADRDPVAEVVKMAGPMKVIWLKTCRALQPRITPGKTYICMLTFHPAWLKSFENKGALMG